MVLLMSRGKQMLVRKRERTEHLERNLIVMKTQFFPVVEIRP